MEDRCVLGAAPQSDTPFTLKPVMALHPWLAEPIPVQIHSNTGDAPVPTVDDRPPPLRYGWNASLFGSVMWTEDGVPSLGAFDNMAGSACCDASNVPHNARIISEKDGTRLIGIGGKITEAGTLYEIDLYLRLGSVKVPFRFRVVEISTPGLRFLWDIAQMRDVLGAVIDINRSCVKSEKLGVVIQTEPVEHIHRRLSMQPIRTLGVCGGMATDLLSDLEMGMRIAEHVLVECSPKAIAVAKVIAAFAHVRLIIIDDVRRTSGQEIGFVHSAVFSPVCGPWSSLLKTAPGFRSALAYTFIECGRLRVELMKINSHMLSTFETNRLHPCVKSDLARQQSLAGTTFLSINASWWGSPSSRWRRFALLNHVFQVEEEDYCSPDTSGYVEGAFRTKVVPTPCIVSAGHTTRAPCIMVHHNNGSERFATPDEADALMGFSPGMSNGWGSLDYSDELRYDLTGRSLNQFHLRVINRYKDLSVRACEPQPKFMYHISSEVEDSDPERMELWMTAAAWNGTLDAYFARRLKDYPDYDLVITMKDDSQMSYQTKYVPTVPAKFVAGAKKKLAKMIDPVLNQWSIKAPSEITPEDWISAGFMKGKGRTDEDGDEVLRFLGDCGVVNAHTVMTSWWSQYKPVMEDFKAQVPHTSTHFSVRDLENAFELIRLHRKSWKYMVFVIRIDGKIYYLQCKVCGQGLALSAYYFPVWLFRKMFRCFGFAFLLWFATYVDDNVVHGPSEERCINRNKIFESFCRSAGIAISPKTPATVTTEVVAAGILMSSAGLSVDDSVAVAVRLRMKVKCRGVKQARNLRGILNASRTAFYMEPGEQRRWAELMHPMDKAIALADANGGKFPTKFWIDEVESQLEVLETFLLIKPRAHIHPGSLITHDSCLIYLTDSSDDAAGGGLYQVQIPDARDVKIPEDLMDPMLSVMVTSIARAHDPEKRSWLTYANETEIGVELIEKTQKRVTEALLELGPTDCCKVAFATDSSTAKATMQGLNDPAAKPEFHTAMARRWIHWSQRMQMTRFWNMHLVHCKGEWNHFADWLSHIGHLLLEQGRKPAAHPVFSVTKEDKKLQALRLRFPVPSGWTLSDSALNLTSEQWQSLSDAQLADTESVFHKVKVSEMFSVLLGDDCSALARDRVKSWSTKMFMIVPPGSSAPTIFVPQSLTRSDIHVFEKAEWNQDLFDDSVECSPCHLVPLIPSNLDVQVSQITPLEGEDPPSLREDLMLLFHEWDAHRSAASLFSVVSSVAWWPSLKSDVYNHVAYCSLCMSKLNALRLSGLGTVLRSRHRHISGDHVILPKWLSSIVGYTAIFVVCDLSDGEMDIFPCKSTGAEEACAWLMNGWCRYRGFFYTFSSDKGSAFTAKVCEIFMRLVGLKVHKFGATDDSRAQASVERKNRLIREIESEISENGAVTSPEEFHFFITRYLIKQTMIRTTGGSTVFERIRGEKAIGLADLLTVSPDISSDLTALQDSDADFITSVASVTAKLMADYAVEKQVRARDNAYTRDSAAGSARGYIQDFERGQTLSYHGKKVTVLDLEGYDGITHIIARVQEGDKPPFRVKCQDLREMCWGRPQWSPSIPLNINLTDVVFFSTPADDFNRVGLVMEIAESQLVVHEYSTNLKLRSRWRPIWERHDKFVVKKICPPGYSASLLEVSISDVEMVGKISGEVFQDNTKRRLIAKGFFWALPVGTPGSDDLGVLGT